VRHPAARCPVTTHFLSERRSCGDHHRHRRCRRLLRRLRFRLRLRLHLIWSSTAASAAAAAAASAIAASATAAFASASASASSSAVFFLFLPVVVKLRMGALFLWWGLADVARQVKGFRVPRTTRAHMRGDDVAGNIRQALSP
jgi:hypothetical protein